MSSFLPHTVANINNFFSAFISAILTYLISNQLKKYGIQINIQSVVFSSICNLLPGLGLTMSICEISTGHIVCGISRFFSSLFTALLLGFGFSLANHWVGFETVIIPSNIDWWWGLILTPMLCYLTCIIFQTGRRQLLLTVSIACIGFAVASILDKSPIFFNLKEGPIIIASFVIGSLSNLYARITGDIAIGSIVVAIYMIVPGSYGVRSSLRFIVLQSEIGMNLVMQMILIAACITIGLFFSTALLWPIRSTKKHVLISF